MGCNCVKTFSKDVIILDLSNSKKQTNNLLMSPTKSDISKLVPESDDNRTLSKPKLRLDYPMSPYRIISSNII